MNGFIYIIRNTINNKVYIGQTRVNVYQRWQEHLRHSKYGNQVINRAMKKYGIDKFYIETLEICNINQLDEREMYYISLYDSTDKSKGYNVSIGGNTPKFKRKELDISIIIDLYLNKQFTLKEIGDRFKVSRYIITTELRNAGISIRDRSTANEKVSKISVDLIKESLSNTTSLRAAAKYAKVKYSTFRSACIFHNIEYNSPTSARHLK
jgi:group I intron endonuclease